MDGEGEENKTIPKAKETDKEMLALSHLSVFETQEPVIQTVDYRPQKLDREGKRPEITKR